jgi:hypothetical protein
LISIQHPNYYFRVGRRGGGGREIERERKMTVRRSRTKRDYRDKNGNKNKGKVVMKVSE